jgi:YD repeat-containing protein
MKTTHTISQPVIDGDSITTGKDTIINETAYDINGNESAVTDGNGNVTTYTYDDQNRVTGVSRKNGLEQTLKLIGAFSFCGKSKKDGGCRIYDLFNH